ncbi:MAG TPA: PAS domain-containing protein [Meiothermus sp.]|nr:PAS domain-containing protein [Meiothermus sp.]
MKPTAPIPVRVLAVGVGPEPQAAGFQVERYGGLEAALSALEIGFFDALLAFPPAGATLEWTRWLYRASPQTPLVVGGEEKLSEEAALEVLRAGAEEYLQAPSWPALERALRRALARRRHEGSRGELLAALGDALQPDHEPEEVARIALEHLGPALQAHNMLVLRLEEEPSGSQQVCLWSHWGQISLENQRLFEGSIPLERFPVLRRVLAEGVPFFSTNYTREPQGLAFALGLELSVAIEPVRNAEGSVVAALAVSRVAQIGGFTPEERDLLSRAAVTVGLALERAQAARLERDSRFRQLVEVGGAAVWVTDPGGELTWANEPFFRLTGLTLEGARGGGWLEAIHPEDRSRAAAAWEHSLATREPYDVEVRLRGQDGQYRYVHSRAVPVLDNEGHVREWIGADTDITERKRVEEHLRVLGEVSSTLAASLDLETTLHNAAHSLVPRVADWCVIDLLEEDGSIRAAIFAHTDPAQVRWAEELRRQYPVDPQAPLGTPQVIRTGQTELYPDIPDSLLAQVAKNEEELNLLRSVGYRSVLVVPLQAHGWVLGAISLGMTESARRFSPADVPMAEELGRRVAVAIYNARLYRSVQESEQKLRESQERLALTIQAGGLGLWDSDLLEHRTYWSAEEERLFGLEPGGFDGQFSSRVHPEDRTRVLAKLQQVQRSGTEYEDQFRIVWPDGTVRWLAARGRVYRDPQGRAVRMLGVNYDITEAKQTEASLQVRVRQQAVVAELSRYALEASEPSEVFEKAVRMLQETLEVEYTKILELLPDGQALLLRAGVGWQEGLVGKATVGAGLDSQAGYTLHLDQPVIVEDLACESRFSGPPLLRDHRVVSGMSTVIRGTPQPFGVLGVHTTSRRVFTPDDVNFLRSVANVLAIFIERHRAEAALRESEERYRKLSEAQKRFVADAAHELRAPLTSIQGNLEILQRFRRMKRVHQEEAVDEAVREAQRLARLVNDMLALARGDAGAKIRREPLDLAAILREASLEARHLSQTHRLEVKLPEALPLSGDPDKLKQLALILLDNAIKYTPQGGKVRLELKQTERHAELRVSDTGIGIAPEDLPRVFERFYRADQSRRRDPGGTGLGLSIAQWIVEQHGGEIWLESQVSQGTTVIVQLPLDGG